MSAAYDRSRLRPATRALHDAIDAHAARAGVAWLHPTEPTIQRDLLGSDGMLAWQEAKAAAAWLGESCWSELPEVYARYGTSGSRALIAGLREALGARGAIVTDCGMQAVGLLADAVLEPRSHVVIVGQVYNKTRTLLSWATARLSGAVRLVPHGDLDALRAALTPAPRLVLLEQPTNPLLRVHDLAAIAEIVSTVPGAVLAVDDTILTPWGPREPLLRAGAHLVLGAGTKALAGDDTALWGYLASDRLDLLNRIQDVAAMRGGVLDGARARQLAAGLDTARQRHAARCASAEALAADLSAHPAVAEVWHPSVPAHPDHALARATLARGGSLLSLRLRGADEAAHRHFADVLAMTGVIRYALSFDGLVTKVNHHPSVSEHGTPEPALRRLGLDRLVRVGVGLEDLQDLIDAFRWALEAAPRLSAADVAAWQAQRRASLGVDPPR